MSKLTWGVPGTRFYETGVDRGVLYIGSDPGVPWSGLVSVTQSPSGASVKKYHLEGVNRLNIVKTEGFQATIEAFYSPKAFDVCDGTRELAPGFYAGQQRRVPFNFSYRTKIGNDLTGSEYGHKIHLIYNALAVPSERTFSTVSSDPEAALLSWTVETQPVAAPGLAPSAHFVINTTEIEPAILEALENILYGTQDTQSRLPLPHELISIFLSDPDLIVVDNGDGTFTVTGPDSKVASLSPDNYMISSSAIQDTGPTFTVLYN